MSLRTIAEADLANKTVLVRVDFNVPMQAGQVTDTTRIDTVKPTIDHLKSQGAKIILCAHMGRPKGEAKAELSFQQIIPTIGDILESPITFIDSLDKSTVDTALDTGAIVMLENLRFDPREKANDPELSKELANLADIYINDAFGVCHRAHASTEGITHLLPSYAGLLVAKEIAALTKIREGEVKHPLTVIVGGAKIDTKIGVLKKFTQKADNILIGGALANTFLLAAGFNIGKSKAEHDKVDVAQEIMLLAEKHHERLRIPKDVIVADEISNDAQTCDLPKEDIDDNMMVLDIGQLTIKKYIETIERSQTIIWNGPMGLYEFTPFAQGTKAIAEAIAASSATTYVGGGDSIDAINKFGIDHSKFTHISTGGGAMIDYLKGDDLPAINALMA